MGERPHPLKVSSQTEGSQEATSNLTENTKIPTELVSTGISRGKDEDSLVNSGGR